MIARTILESPLEKLLVQDTCEAIEKMYPYFRTARPGWRNNVRHYLSKHKCFIKSEKCKNRRGHYWRINQANIGDFLMGDFREWLVKARVQSVPAYIITRTCTPEYPSLMKPEFPAPPNSLYYPHSAGRAAFTELFAQVQSPAEN